MVHLLNAEASGAVKNELTASETEWAKTIRNGPDGHLIRDGVSDELLLTGTYTETRYQFYEAEFWQRNLQSGPLPFGGGGGSTVGKLFSGGGGKFANYLQGGYSLAKVHGNKFATYVKEVPAQVGGAARAVYTKTVNSTGNTVRMFKDTFTKHNNFWERAWKFPRKDRVTHYGNKGR